MGRNKTDRVGEKNINNFGSKMVIIEYRGALDIDIYFPEYNWTFKHTRYNNFKKGEIKCPYERRAYDIGYLGEGKYKIYKNGKRTKCYTVWGSMLNRCCSGKLHKRESTYINCKVCDEWLNFQNFSEWFKNNYYEVEGQRMELDKDILNKGNKIYSPNTCIFVPHNINNLFTKNDKIRGDYPIGVCYDKARGKFIARCSVYDFKENKKKSRFLGYYSSQNKAFEAYKQFKENSIREIADYYKEQIPNKLYNAMYEYKVDIDD